jgi:hypothetical protein
MPTSSAFGIGSPLVPAASQDLSQDGRGDLAAATAAVAELGEAKRVPFRSAFMFSGAAEDLRGFATGAKPF